MANFLDSIPLPENRPALEQLIEAALARLDALDGDPDLEQGDPDLEDGGDGEPWLGSIDPVNQGAWSLGSDDDREGWANDLEPSLGAIERGEGSQVMWAAGGFDDCEGTGEAPMWIPGAAPEVPVIPRSACIRRAV